MRLKTLIAVAVAGAFAVPFAAQVSAAADNMILAQAGGPAGASSTGTGPTGGTPSPRTAGEPKAPAGGAMAGATSDRAMSPSFSEVDKDNDGQISRAEWDAYFRSGSATSGGSTTSPSTGAVSPSGSGTTGTTAGPDAASNKTAPSSDTATSPSTSGQGKPE
jgi:hypothetical protein